MPFTDFSPLTLDGLGLNMTTLYEHYKFKN